MGIIDGSALALTAADQTTAQHEADTIFGCVFLGFIAEAQVLGKSLRWSVAPEDEAKVGVLRDVLNACSDIAGIARSNITAGIAPIYNEETMTIAIAAQGKGVPAPIQPTQQAVRERIAALLRDTGLRSTLNNENGAYYGIVDHKDNVHAKAISSVRRLIPYGGEGGRWNRNVPNHGLIGYEGTEAGSPEGLRDRAEKQAGSIEPTALIKGWNGHDRVCGYCHGMVWAVAQASTEFRGGVPYELGLGSKTHKLASCFGCSTFLVANGYMPSAMHLGRSESWVPLPEGEDAAAPFDNGTASAAMESTFEDLNSRWAGHVAAWLEQGIAASQRWTAARAGRKEGPVVPDWATDAVNRLERRLKALGSDRKRANVFLDALTVHSNDTDRLARFCGIQRSA